MASNVNILEKYSYLINTTINKWTVLELQRGRPPKALCRCECGTVKYVNLYNLINNKSKDCGCGRKRRLSQICSKDLTGQHFGKLTVMEMLPSNNLQKRLFRCKCECGNETIVVGGSLTSGHTQSCGCLNSYGNMKINNILSIKGIEFKKEYQINFRGKYYKFDFYLPQYNLMIEYDGEQHFMPVRFCGSDKDKNLEAFKIVQQHDLEKNEYCKINNYNLLRIPYTERENIEEIIENHLQRLSDKDTN